MLRLRFVRFLLIGVVNTIFGYSIFAAMFLATGQPELSIIVATAIGVLFNFMSTGRVVFGNRSGRALPAFILGYCVILILNIVMVRALLALGFHGLVAQAISLPLLVMSSYLINLLFVFRRVG